MEQADQPPLDLWLEIDQQVAADHEVRARERRILDQVLRGEDHHVANRRPDLDAVARAIKPAVDQVFGQVRDRRRGKTARPRPRQGRERSVGREYFHLRLGPRLVQEFKDRNRDGIGFLSGGTARGPDADRPLCRPSRNKRLQHLFRQTFPRPAIPEERGHGDQHVLQKKVGFLFGSLDIRGIGIPIRKPEEMHAAVDPAEQRPDLVLPEVDGTLALQRAQDPLEGIDLRCLAVRHPRGTCLATLPRGVIAGHGLAHNLSVPKPRGIANKRRNHLCRLEHHVHEARLDGPPRHLVELGAVGRLCNHAAAGFAHPPKRRRAVRSGARADDRRRPVAKLSRKTANDVVDRPMRASGGALPRDQGAIRDIERPVGRQDIDGPAGDHCRIVHCRDRKVDPAAQQLDQVALLIGRQVEDDDIRHLRPRLLSGHRVEEVEEALQGPGRSAQGDHRKA